MATVKEIIKELEKFNPDAKVAVIAHNKAHNFSLSWGSQDGEGVKKGSCTSMAFYVDELCQSEGGN